MLSHKFQVLTAHAFELSLFLERNFSLARREKQHWRNHEETV